jgi:SNF family Na+-dependent transporter
MTSKQIDAKIREGLEGVIKGVNMTLELSHDDLMSREVLESMGEAFVTMGVKFNQLAGLVSNLPSTEEVINTAQACLTALNTGNLEKDSLLHLELRKVLIAYREGN